MTRKTMKSKARRPLLRSGIPFRWYALTAGAALAVVVGVAVVKNYSKAAGTWPTADVAAICGNASVLGNGPTAAPVGAITVPAGNNSAVNFTQDGKTFWFAPGTHTLGTGLY